MNESQVLQLCDIRCQVTTCRGNQVANALREIREQPKTLHISRTSGTWRIHSSENVVLGVINHRTASNLASLPCGDQLTYEVFMECSELEQTIDAYLRGNKKVQFDIAVNIMGPESIFEVVGQQLSERRLFLQRPYQLPDGTAYNNPQYLAVNDPLENALEGYDCEEEIPKTDSLDGDQLLAHDDLNDELWNLIDNLSLPEEIARVEIDQRINTSLKE